MNNADKGRASMYQFVCMTCKTFLLFLAVCSVAACMQQPTETTAVIDNRPTLTFKLSRPGGEKDYQVYVDDLLMGNISQYKSGKAGLRVLSGSHIIVVRRGNVRIMEEKIFVGDGTTKQIVVSNE